MASVMTNYFGNLVLKRYFIDARAWLVLLTADPTPLGSMVDEVVGGDYVRQRYVGSTPGVKTTGNIGQIVFENMPAATIYYLALADAQYGGHLLTVSNRLTVPLIVADSARLVIPPANLAIIF